jgi:ADP-heptose:LPS heptosyltransferase
MTAPAAGPPAFLAQPVSELFEKPVVAVHPGVGNVMRQWPPEHFASLVDLLIEKNGVNVILVGGPEEAELADEVLGQVLQQQSVVSLVGKTSLRQLPDLLRACALYVGNNSGPKHIAAAIGVPTIGIHSGVVDATEWGPIGRRAVAVRRNMACSPCYLARQEDCPRNFACMRGLEPASVHAIAETFLAHQVQLRTSEPLIEQAYVVPAQIVDNTLTRPPAEARPRRRRSRAVTAVSAD